ncbi:SAM-dependent methyltransferase [Micromonospora sp. NPDC049175]|uniref:SAM-dependent methyltransferase n=1 Tax=Micromonospora sp. NPDC049175 TaxID=3364266 RepID=UPI00371E4DFB
MTNEASLSFPRSSQYSLDWLKSCVSGGANSLWLTEWLTQQMPLQKGMRVLDLGSGRGASSIFMSREFGVEVWSVDLWFGADERAHRIRDAGLDKSVFALHADAKSLPFSTGFFDAVTSIDSFMYFGTDDLFMNYLARFVKPGGLIGIANAGLMQEIDGPIPDHLAGWWEPSMACLHSAGWWSRHWQRSGVVAVEAADAMPDGWKRWLEWQYAVAPDNSAEIGALKADQGRNLGYVRAVCRRLPEAALDEPITSIPVDYEYRPIAAD